jgi:hypothetical protein
LCGSSDVVVDVSTVLAAIIVVVVVGSRSRPFPTEITVHNYLVVVFQR